MSFTSFSETLEYPLFGAVFISADTFVVCGGGGEGRHGIPNGLKSFQIVESQSEKANLPSILNRKKLEKRGEYVFEKGSSDAPMCMEFFPGKNTIIVGCNDAKSVLEATKENHNLRVFKVGKAGQLSAGPVYDLFGDFDSMNYLKKIKIAWSGKVKKNPFVGALSSNDESKLYVNRISELGKQNVAFFEGLSGVVGGARAAAEAAAAAAAKKTINDFDVCDNDNSQFQVAEITKKKIFLVSGSIGSSCSTKEITPSSLADSYQLLKVAFLSSSTFVVLGNYPAHKKVFAQVYSEGVHVKTSNILTKIKSVNALDFKLYPNKRHGLMAVATSDLSVVLFDVNLGTGKFIKVYEFPKVHTFALTNIVISPELHYIVSVSAANSVDVIELPGIDDLVRMGNSEWSWIWVLIVLLAILAEFIRRVL